MIKIAETPELIALLKDFAMGDRGTDEIRLDAVQYLFDNNYLPTAPTHMWIKGKWTEILPLNFEITRDALHLFKSSAVEDLASHAIAALYAKNAEHAQSLLEQALEIEEAPSLLNNLASALELQGQSEQAHAIVSSIHTRFPDYFFGIISTARLAFERGDLDEARDMLDGLSRRKRMHITEFDALCEAQIQLGLTMEKPEIARFWLQMWENVNPEDSRLSQYRLMLSRPKLLDRLRKSLGK